MRSRSIPDVQSGSCVHDVLPSFQYSRDTLAVRSHSLERKLERCQLYFSRRCVNFNKVLQLPKGQACDAIVTNLVRLRQAVASCISGGVRSSRA